MSRPTFTVQRRDKRAGGSIFEVLTDTVVGFDDFVRINGGEILPGSTVDFADYRKVYRLRNDGEWEEYQSYVSEDMSEEEAAAAEEAMIADILDGLIPDDAIDGGDTE